jgi:hypothetical protein
MAAADFVAEVRVRDMSRAGLNAGTEIPAIPETKSFTSRIDLLAVPAAAPFRSLVRIYDFDPGAGHSVRVRILRPLPGAPDALVSEQIVALHPQADSRFDPGYGEISLPQSADAPDGLRVEIIPLT